MNTATRNEFPKRRIAYLVKTFPRLSETFILNEILGLERLGVDLHIFSLRSSEEPAVQPAVAQVKAKVTYVPEMGPQFRLGNFVKLVGCHLRLAFTGPARYGKAAKFYFFQPGKSRLKDFWQAGYLAWALRKDGFEHLHVHFANVPATVAEVVQQFIGIPFSLTAHAKDIYLTPADELARKIRSAECVLTCTAYNQRYLANLADGRTPVRLAYHGIDLTRFSSSSRCSPAAENGPPLILSVGRLCGKKGFQYLIRACRILKDRGHSFRCEIVGYGDLQEKLQRLITANGLEGLVSLSGSMTQDQVAALYRHARMFVLPCVITENGDRDGIPNVLFEAMASGVPVISTDVSGISELVRNEENGLLVEQRNVRALAEAMEILLLRPDVCRRLAENGRETVLQNFSLESSAQRVHEILCSVTTPQTVSDASALRKADLVAS